MAAEGPMNPPRNDLQHRPLDAGPPPAHKAERRRRYATGRTAEIVAAGRLMLAGYRILARRVRTPLGEIDLIARRGARLAFVEVKARATLAEAEAALTPRQGERMRRAADLWLARRPHLQSCERVFDAVVVLPRSWPLHLPNRM
ncbi:MAG: YraN family protein [Hyphomicrobiaceae bacterium]|nr:YraN family protein [Hyphomicrobiaceae bacterium]